MPLTLLTPSSSPQKWLSIPQVMTPRVDGAFLRAHPASLLQSGLYNEVDLISGVTEVEAALPALGKVSSVVFSVRSRCEVCYCCCILCPPLVSALLLLYYLPGLGEYSEAVVVFFARPW